MNSKLEEQILSHLLNASDMRVNLIFEQEKRCETHKLRYALIKNRSFWVKTGNIYPPNLFGNTETGGVKSRIFSNFCNMDCITDINTRSYQLVSSQYYDNKRFVATKSFKKLWEYGEEITPELFVSAVENAQRLKCVIHDLNGLIIVTPIHTFEALTEEISFRFDTEYDGFPSLLQDFDTCMQYANEFDKIYDDGNGRGVPQSEFFKNNEFILTYFEVTPKKVVQKTVSEDGSIGAKILPLKSLKIYVES